MRNNKAAVPIVLILSILLVASLVSSILIFRNISTKHKSEIEDTKQEYREAIQVYSYSTENNPFVIMPQYPSIKKDKTFAVEAAFKNYHSTHTYCKLQIPRSEEQIRPDNGPNPCHTSPRIYVNNHCREISPNSSISYLIPISYNEEALPDDCPIQNFKRTGYRAGLFTDAYVYNITFSLTCFGQESECMSGATSAVVAEYSTPVYVGVGPYWYK